MPYLPEWSEEDHLKLMDDLNIRKSILSVSSPGTHLIPGNDELAAEIARGVNKFGSDLKTRLPDRFGYFASLPIPNVQLCLEEIGKSIEEGCDGFVMMTNGHGVYPGDPGLDPVFDELNRRKAVLFFHPTTPTCACSPSDLQAGKTPEKAAPFAGKYPNPMLEFFFDTARVVTNLFLSGTVKRCPDIQFIFAHCGGAMPPMLSRFTTFSSLLPGSWTQVSEQEAREAFAKQVWFDIAGISFPGQIRGLLETGGDSSRLFYGSDYPFTRPAGVEMLVKQMDNGVKGLFDDEQIEAIYHGNAEKLFGH